MQKYDQHDTVSILELSRIIQRKRIGLAKETIIKLCRYLIEPRTKQEILFNEQAERLALQVFEQLVNFIGKYSWTEDEEKLNSNIKTVNFIKI